MDKKYYIRNHKTKIWSVISKKEAIERNYKDVIINDPKDLTNLKL